MSAEMYLLDLERKITSQTATVAVMGLGYVGLPLLCACFKAGFGVMGLDLAADKIAALQAGQNYIQDVDNGCIQAMSTSSRASFSADTAVLPQADVVLICVPTPLHKSKEPDLSYILGAAEAIAMHLRPGQLIILESTTYPGTTDEVLLPIFAAARPALQVGQDLALAFSPERIDPGNPHYRVENIPKVVGGLTSRCGELAEAFYRQIELPVHRVSSARVAETAKILENTFRSVNIALVNEFAGICRALGIDVWEVIEAAATKPFGFMKFLPGPGIGGHCIPLDPHYLIWKSRLHGFEPRFMALADQINASMPQMVVQLAMEALNEEGKALKGSQILLLGVAYKADIEDARESPAHYILPLLQQKGAKINYHDPHVSSFEIETQRYVSVDLSPELLAAQDLVIILTAHAQVDYQRVADQVSLLLDTRNVSARLQASRAKVLRL